MGESVTVKGCVCAFCDPMECNLYEEVPHRALDMLHGNTNRA